MRIFIFSDKKIISISSRFVFVLCMRTRETLLCLLECVEKTSFTNPYIVIRVISLLSQRRRKSEITIFSILNLVFVFVCKISSSVLVKNVINYLVAVLTGIFLVVLICLFSLYQWKLESFIILIFF